MQIKKREPGGFQENFISFSPVATEHGRARSARRRPRRTLSAALLPGAEGGRHDALDAQLLPFSPCSPVSLLFLSPAAELHHCRRCRLSPPPVGSSPSRSTRGSRSALTFSSSPHKESGRGRSSRRRHPLLLPRRPVAVEDAIVTVRSFPPSPRTLTQSRVSSASFWLSPAPPPPLLVAVTVRRRRRLRSGAPGLAPGLGRPGGRQPRPLARPGPGLGRP